MERNNPEEPEFSVNTVIILGILFDKDITLKLLNSSFETRISSKADLRNK